MYDDIPTLERRLRAKDDTIKELLEVLEALSADQAREAAWSVAHNPNKPDDLGMKEALYLYAKLRVQMGGQYEANI